jgi:hypothetical protein
MEDLLVTGLKVFGALCLIGFVFFLIRNAWIGKDGGGEL